MVTASTHYVPWVAITQRVLELGRTSGATYSKPPVPCGNHSPEKLRDVAEPWLLVVDPQRSSGLFSPHPSFFSVQHHTMSPNAAFLDSRSSSSLGVEVRRSSREMCLGPRTPRVFTPVCDPGHEWRPTWRPHCLACCWLLAGKAECNLSLLSGQTIGLERMDLEHVRKGGVERSYTGLHGVGWGIHAPPLEKSSQGLKKHLSP